MNKVLLALVTMVVSGQLLAAETTGTRKVASPSGKDCGLTEEYGEDQEPKTTFDVSKTVNGKKMNLKRAQYLPKVVRAQMVHAANAHSSELNGNQAVNSNLNPREAAKAALKYLWDNSEGADVYIERVEIEGKKYSAVVHFPGGNQYGYIFPWGSSKPIASIGDGWISCIK